MTKRVCCFVLVLAMLFCPMVYAPALGSSVRVVVDGSLINFPDQQPITRNNRTYIPVRLAAEGMGAEVSWDVQNGTMVVYISSIDVVLRLQVGSPELSHGFRRLPLYGYSTTMDVEPILVNNRVLIPIRFVAEALGWSVTWDAGSGTVNLDKASAISRKPAAEVKPLVSSLKDYVQRQQSLITSYDPAYFGTSATAWSNNDALLIHEEYMDDYNPELENNQSFNVSTTRYFFKDKKPVCVRMTSTRDKDEDFCAYFSEQGEMLCFCDANGREYLGIEIDQARWGKYAFYYQVGCGMYLYVTELLKYYVVYGAIPVP